MLWFWRDWSDADAQTGNWFQMMLWLMFNLM
jgi:hypothetical protein